MPASETTNEVSHVTEPKPAPPSPSVEPAPPEPIVEPAPAPAAPPLSYDELASRIHALYYLSSGVNEGAGTSFGLGFQIPQRGYTWFFETYIDTLIRAGVRRFILDRPFSAGVIDQPGQPMNFDARVDLVELGQGGLVDELAVCLRRRARSNPDVRFLCYLGSMREPDLTRLAAQRRNVSWLSRATRSISPLLDIPTVEIAFDHSVTYAPGSREQAFVDLVDAMIAPRPIYIEARPRRSRPDQHARNVCCTLWDWQRTSPSDDVLGGYQDAMDIAPSQMLSGRVVLMDSRFGSFAQAGEYPQRAAMAIGQSHPEHQPSLRIEYAAALYQYFLDRHPTRGDEPNGLHMRDLVDALVRQLGWTPNDWH